MSNVGLCICHYEPRGDNGLEGYQLGDKYIFIKMPAKHGIKTYVKVFPAGIDYYETCGPMVFKRYFKIKE